MRALCLSKLEESVLRLHYALAKARGFFKPLCRRLMQAAVKSPFSRPPKSTWLQLHNRLLASRQYAFPRQTLESPEKTYLPSCHPSTGKSHVFPAILFQMPGKCLFVVAKNVKVGILFPVRIIKQASIISEEQKNITNSPLVIRFYPVSPW